MKYTNPIIPGFHPDPSICRVGEWFYLVTSTFEYFPGVPLFKSQNLVDWQQIGHCLTRESQLDLHGIRKSGGIYAPSIRYNNGRFYMVTTHVDKGGNFYVYTDDIEGEWSDPIWVDIGGIDPQLYFDEDGQTYIVTNEGTDAYFGHIVLAQIDIETGEKLTETRELWKGTGGQYVEGPHIYKKDGYYYLMCAEGGTSYNHMETIARSRDIWGPYESNPSNPILTHRERSGNPIQATGHGDLVEDANGDWWLLFLGIRPSVAGFHHLGRETFLAPVDWDEMGWPVVNGGEEIQLAMEVDRELISEEVNEDDGEKVSYMASLLERETFANETLGSHWNWIRNYNKANYSYGPKTKGLILRGTRVSLDQVDSPTFLGVRQQHMNCNVKVAVDTSTLVEGDEAGISAFYSDEHHYDLAVVLEEQQLYVQLKKTVGDIQFIQKKEAIFSGSHSKIDEKGEGTIILEIKACPTDYSFAWRYRQGAINPIGSGRTQLISCDIATGKFTGTYFGLYAISPNNTKVRLPWFDYKV